MKVLTKKIKAFTVAELLIVLVISSIVVGLSLTVLNLVQRQLVNIQNNYAKNTEVRLLERALHNDFYNYNLNLDANNKGLQAYHENDTINYQFKEQFLLRNTDTLSVAIYQIKAYLDGNQVNSGPIDALELSLSKAGPEYRFFISKRKDATFYMNTDGI